MITRYISLAVFALMSCFASQGAIAQVDPGQGTWTSTLQGRDLNGDHVADAYYDTVLGVTWLADANYAATTGFAPGGGDPYYSPAGGMTYSTASSWVSGLNVNGVTGWRLPNATFTGTANDSGCSLFFIYPPAGCNYQPDPGSNELAHLFLITLGNSGATGLTNVGGFTNVAGSDTHMLYYAGAPVVQGEWTSFSSFHFSQGIAVVNPQEFVPSFAWVVHDGDVGVAAVPEPSTYAMMLGGLVALGLAARRKRRA